MQSSKNIFVAAVTCRRPLLYETITNFQQSTKPELLVTFKQNSLWPHSNLPTNNHPPRPIRIAILDSSFNPPTKAHAHLLTRSVASLNQRGLQFDASLLLFSTVNADKALQGAGILERAMMMEILARKLASEQGTETALADIAVAITKHAKFIEKAEAISNFFSGHSNISLSPGISTVNECGAELFFIMGHDTLIRLFNQRYYTPITTAQALAPFFHTSRVISTNRDGFTEDERATFFNTEDVILVKDKILQVQIEDDMAMLSSTSARKAINQKNWEEAEKIVDEAVLIFIKNEILYV